MSIALLDVSVLTALFDRGHARSNQVADWFAAQAPLGWSSCAITENGFVRIVSQPTYPHPIQTRQAISMLAAATSHHAHEFWPCDLSIAKPGWMAPDPVLRSSQLADVYLLALAAQYHGQFVTLDRRIEPNLVTGATAENLVIL